MKKLADVSSIVENFELFGTQLNSFVEEINAKVRKGVEDDTTFSIHGKSSRDTDNGRSKWINVAVSLSIPIKARSNSKTVYLSFIIELTSQRIFGQQLKADLAETPLLHVAISSVQAAFNNQVGDCWIAQIPPASDEDFQLEDSALWVWGWEGADKRPFDFRNGHMLFSYPLEVFSGPAEVEKHLVDPLIKILNGDPPAEALKGAPLIRYQLNDDKSSYSLLVKM